MKQMEKYLKGFGFFLGGILLLAFFLSFFNLIGVLKSTVTTTLIMILMVLFFLFIGYHYGKNATAKGYLEGLKVGLFLILFLLLFNLIFFQSSFTIGRFIYYIMLLLSTIFGSMIGINKKKA